MKFSNWFKAAAVCGVVCGVATAKADTYALLIGINDYPDVVDDKGNPILDDKGQKIDPDLRGCVNDANAMKTILTSKYGVKAENTHLLLNKDANETKFIAEMKWLLGAVKPGDQIVFFYSGHGGQIKSKDESDGIDEVIVLADDKLVPDNFFADLTKVLSNAGVNSTFIFDSCYGGGMDRKPGALDKAFPDLMKVATKSTKYRKLDAATLKTARASVKQTQGVKKGEYAFLMGGQEDQPTIDISNVKGIPDHGIFTLFLTAALTDDPDSNLEDLVATTKKTIGELKFEQVPKGEFSSAARAKKPLILRS